MYSGEHLSQPNMVYSTEYLKILVIEDNEGDFVIISELLEDEIAHPELHQATSLSEATTLLSANHGFDVVLLDLTLPDSRGTELVDHVLRLAAQIPVVVLTGYSDKGFGIKTLAQGASDYLLKDELYSFQLYKSISYSIERKKIHNQLSESERKYRNLFHLSPIPMWVFEQSSHHFLDVNAAAIRHYGYTYVEFLTMSLGDLAAGEKGNQRHREEEVLAPAVDHSFQGIFRHRKKNGEVIDVEIESNEIDFNGLSARLVMANDITEKLIARQRLHKSEENLRLLNTQLERIVAERTKELSEALVQLEAFTSSISHDLQAPLRPIMMFAQILVKEAVNQLSSEHIQYLEHIVDSSQKMRTLIKDLLEFSRIGKGDIKKVEIDTQAMVHEVWNRIPKEKSKVLHFEAIGLPNVIGDESMIRQVFQNLLSNAYKYSSFVDEQRISVHAQEQDKEVVFTVQDNGCGFDMDYYGDLFGIFKRLHSSSQYEGTGVGLSIVKLIVEKHNGRIWAESVLGEGATFHFSLPRVLAA